MNKLLLLASVAFASLAVQASAQTPDQMNRWPHWYLGLHGFVPFVEETDLDAAGGKIGELDFDPGWGAGVSLGYKPGNTGTFLDAMRFEVEYTYRENDNDKVTLTGGGFGTVSGDLSSHAGMFNAYYDIDTQTQFVPYLGAGLGVAHMDLMSDNDSVFAYQGMVGVSYAPETVRNTMIGLGYRYFATSSPEYDIGGARLEHDYDTHNVELNARFAF